MILFIKNKTVYNFCLITVIVLFILFFGGIKRKKQVQEVIALPTNNKVIVLDAGHGAPDMRCRK